MTSRNAGLLRALLHDINLNRCFFFFMISTTTEIYTLSLHDALPICPAADYYMDTASSLNDPPQRTLYSKDGKLAATYRSEEHTSELQSHVNLVCRLLLEKKNRADSRQAARRALRHLRAWDRRVRNVH